MSAETQSMEHRWGTRMPVHAPAQIVADGGLTINVEIDNASLSGAFVRTPRRLPVLSRVVLRHAGEGDQRLEACVVRHDAAGMGIEWLDPGLRALCALLSLREDVRHMPARPGEGRLPGSRHPVMPPHLMIAARGGGGLAGHQEF